MKIDYNDNNLIVFLNKKNIDGVDFYDKSSLESYFRKLFSKLGDYGIELGGSYNITVYVDKCGVVLEVFRDDVDYYYDVDMNITVSKYSGFIYRVNDFLFSGNYYCYNGCLFLEPDDIDFVSYGILIENSDIIYGRECFDIKRKGILIDNCVQNMYN